MPLIKVEMFAGRSIETKRKLVQVITDAYVEITGVKPQSVTVILNDVAKQDWAVGGSLCSDLYPDQPNTMTEK